MERKTKIKNQKGFIQIPILIIVVSIVIAGVILHKQEKLLPALASVSELFENSSKENLKLSNIQEANQKDNKDLTVEIEELKKEITSAPLPNPTPAQIPVVSIPKQETPTQAQPPTESWSRLESKYFSEANQKGWVTLIITNALGEKRYYRKEGSLWIRKNSKAEIKQSYVPPPTTEQLRKIRRVCLLDKNAPICIGEDFMPWYISNLTFRMLIDPKIDQILILLEAKKNQQFAAEIKTIDCLMAPTPEDERMLSPATQNYLRQIRCGTVTNADRTNYELSRIKSSVDELKYRLETKTSFPPVLFDTLEPTDWGNRWEIRWDGSGGGRIKDSNGGFYQFRCENNYCVSY